MENGRMKNATRKQAEIMLSDDIANGEVSKNISREEKERILQSYEKWLNEQPKPLHPYANTWWKTIEEKQEQLVKLRGMILEEIANWERHKRIKITTYDERTILDDFIRSLRIIVKVIDT